MIVKDVTTVGIIMRYTFSTRLDSRKCLRISVLCSNSRHKWTNRNVVMVRSNKNTIVDILCWNFDRNLLGLSIKHKDR